jgi:hypothetical protein
MRPAQSTDLIEESLEETQMKKANLYAIMVVLIGVAGCSNHLQQVIAKTEVPASADTTSLSTSAPTSPTVSGAPGPEVNSLIPQITERAKSDLLSAIAVAMNQDKEDFCEASQSANCDQDFLNAFHFRKVALSKSGQTAYIVEFSSGSFCGSAGCSINLLKQNGDKIERTFENDEVGSVDSFEFATTTTNGFYDLTKHGNDGMDYYYAWTGSNYEDVESPLSGEKTRIVVGTSVPAQKECNSCIAAKPVGVSFSRNSAAIR